MKIDKDFLEKIIKEEVAATVGKLAEDILPAGEEAVSTEQLDSWWDDLDDSVKMGIMRQAMEETAQEAE
tara:strand:+ start:947 stop:1153 length:207 start_codon:yes stop_codon:yes gene_type:complete